MSININRGFSSSGISIHSELPNLNDKIDDILISANIDIDLNNIAIPIQKDYSEDGQALCVLPNGYYPYYVNEEANRIGILSVLDKGEYIEYAAPIGYDFEGYIGIKEEYKLKLMVYNSLKEKMNTEGIKLTAEEFRFYKEMVQLERIVKKAYYNNYGKTNSRS